MAQEERKPGLVNRVGVTDEDILRTHYVTRSSLQRLSTQILLKIEHMEEISLLFKIYLFY